MVPTVLRERAIAVTIVRRSPPTRVMSEAAIATSVPVPMAMPRSAWASAGASLIPSPIMATVLPSACDGFARLRSDRVGDGDQSRTLATNGDVRRGRAATGQFLTPLLKPVQRNPRLDHQGT